MDRALTAVMSFKKKRVWKRGTQTLELHLRLRPPLMAARLGSDRALCRPWGGGAGGHTVSGKPPAASLYQ